MPSMSQQLYVLCITAWAQRAQHYITAHVFEDPGNVTVYCSAMIDYMVK